MNVTIVNFLPTRIQPTYLQANLRTFDLNDLKCQFDSIIVDAPLEEYKTTATNEDYWNWDDIMRLDIESISAPRSFIFLWCGSTAGLDYGRQCLQKWGFRRCEDICWIKTNSNRARPKMLQPSGIFYRVKEHCLMGIKGTVRYNSLYSFIFHHTHSIKYILSLFELNPFFTGVRRTAISFTPISTLIS